MEFKEMFLVEENYAKRKSTRNERISLAYFFSWGGLTKKKEKYFSGKSIKKTVHLLKTLGVLFK